MCITYYKENVDFATPLETVHRNCEIRKNLYENYIEPQATKKCAISGFSKRK